MPGPRLVALVALAILALGGCKASRAPVFEWTPAQPAGAAAGQGGLPHAGDIGQAGGHPGGPGSAGIGGELGQAGGSGAAPIDDDVEFRWTETLPRDGGCAGSVFVGGVTCGVPNLPSLFSGTMLLQLSGPSESQELLVTSGIISVPLGPNGAVSLTTGVTGTVDCMSRKLTGEIPRTMLTAEQTGLLFPIITILLCAAGDAVEGSVQGTLDPNGLGILGEVSMTIGTCMCTGTFDLRSQQ